MNKMLVNTFVLDFEEFTISYEGKTKKTHDDTFYNGRKQWVLWDHQEGPIVLSEEFREGSWVHKQFSGGDIHEPSLRYGSARSRFVRL